MREEKVSRWALPSVLFEEGSVKCLFIVVGDSAAFCKEDSSSTLLEAPGVCLGELLQSLEECCPSVWSQKISQRG